MRERTENEILFAAYVKFVTVIFTVATTLLALMSYIAGGAK